MSDREIIDKVLLILGPSASSGPAQRRKLELTISYGLVSARRNSKETIASGRYGVRTVKHKKAAAKVEVAIHRLQSALRDPNLARQYWPDEDEDPERFDTSLEALRQRYKADAQKTLPEEQFRAVDWPAHNAAKAAAKVCKMCDLPRALAATASS